MGGTGSKLNFPLDSWLGGLPPNTILGVAVRDALGVDIATGPDGKAVTTTAGDYQIVAGVENFRRSVLRRLRARKGSFRVRPQFGCGVPAYVKKPMTQANLDLCRHDILENLAQDRRVDQVELLRVTQATDLGPNALRVELRVIAKGKSIVFEPFTFTEKGAA